MKTENKLAKQCKVRKMLKTIFFCVSSLLFTNIAIAQNSDLWTNGNMKFTIDHDNNESSNYYEWYRDGGDKLPKRLMALYSDLRGVATKKSILLSLYAHYNGDGYRIFSMDDTKTNGLSFKNSDAKYLWYLHRTPAITGGLTDLVFSGGIPNSSLPSLPELMRIKHNGNIGIGIASPTSKLHVKGKITTQSSATWDRLDMWADGYSSYIQSNGDENGMKISSQTGNKIMLGDSDDKVGIGFSLPTYKLHVKGIIAAENGSVVTVLSKNKLNNTGWIGTVSNHGLYIGTNNDGTNLYLDNDDNTFVGGKQTVSDTFKTKYNLFVKKGILTEDIALASATGWADYVFSKDYKLKPLEEVKRFIDQKGHLPNIASEEDVKKKGYNMHEMNVTFLEKIEELFLYTIEQEDKIKTMELEISKLKGIVSKIEELEKKLN